MTDYMIMSPDQRARELQRLMKLVGKVKTELKGVLDDLNAPEGNLTEQFNKLWVLWEAL